MVVLPPKNDPPRNDELLRLEASGILASRTFRRSDQLRRFLQYVCELEGTGRRIEITEHSIATKALGRGEDFCPDEDSTVRTRAHALREKLGDYYRDERPDSAVRLELPKGSYVPVLRSTVAQVPESPPTIVLPPRDWTSPLVAAAVTLLFVAGLIGFVWKMGWLVLSPALATSQAVRELWGPLLRPGEIVTICVGQPPHVWVRNYGKDLVPVQNAPFPDPAPKSPPFMRWYESFTGQTDPSGLFVHPSPNASLWGDVAGAATAGNFLARQGVNVEFLPERSLRSTYILRDRNTLVFGRPEYSPLVASVIRRGYTVQYLRDLRRHAIAAADPALPRYMNSMQQDQTNFGLVTVLTSESLPRRRTIVFTGITSDGSQAGANFLLSDSKIEDLSRKLKIEGHRSWPKNFQVILRTTSSEGYPLRVEYENHLVWK